METERDTILGELHNPTFRCIAVKQRRTALEALLTWGSPLSEQRLAAYLAADERGTPSIAETDVGAVRLELVTIHLPALMDARLIERDRESQEIRTTDHPAMTDPRFHQLLSLESDGLETIFNSLAHEYRRLTLSVLRKSQSALSRRALAREICHHLEDENEPPTEEIDEVETALHHVHLPKLGDAEFIAYVPETGHVSYSADPVLEDVFSIIHDPGEALPEKATGFFDELRETVERSKPDAAAEYDWPHEWRRAHHG